jgi:hypothetical protein
MTMSIKTLRILIIAGGMLGGVCHVDVALSETVQIHTPTVQIHTPTIHAPKTPQIHTTTTTKINSKVISKTNAANSADTANTTDAHTGSSSDSNAGGQSQMPPQGVRFNQPSKNGKITVTIDGKTLPMNKATAQLIKEAETPPPKMWLNGKLVPVTQANMQAAKEEEVKEIDSKIYSKGGSTKAPKLGGKEH